MKVPILDNRTKREIYAQMIALAKQYVPQWNTEGEEDVGTLLYQIFAEQLEDTIKQYNKLPYRNMLSFLNLLGADTLPGTPATGYATVYMNPGEYHGVAIAKGTRLFAEKEGKERVLYETENSFLAVPNSIEAIYCTTGDKSCIVSAYEAHEKEQKQMVLFDFDEEKNLQQYCILLSSKDIFYVSPQGEIEIALLHDKKQYMAKRTADILADKYKTKWEALTEAGWRAVDAVKSIDTSVVLKTGFEIPFLMEEQTKQQGRWLRCSFLQKTDMPIAVTEIRIAAVCRHLEASALQYNDLTIKEEEGLPFGERFSVYDAFYINAQEAFCKKNASITIDIAISHREGRYDDVIPIQRPVKWKSILSEAAVQPPEKLPITIQEVVWEYWNGMGWSPLYPNGKYNDFFAGEEDKREQMTFCCPYEMEEMLVGAKKGYWIRARILHITNLFAQQQYYNVPVLEQISISYHAMEPKALPDFFFIKKDMETILKNPKQSSEITLLPQKEAGQPACYFSLSRPMQGGPIQLFFQNAKANAAKRPAIKWEYFGEQNGAEKWIGLQLLDETMFFSQSGFITYMIQFPMKKKKLFQKNSFWLRAVNTDGAYERESIEKPCLSAIYFNTVKIIQQETMEEAYFYILPEQQHKKCTLLFGNITKLEVYIKEKQDDDFSEPQWVKWQETDSFLHCNERSRVYLPDRKKGEVVFGDGKRGKIPPSAQEPTIRISYCVCRGEEGNCSAKELTDFADAVAFVDYVTNHNEISGGCDVENTEAALQRSKNMLKIQQRAVSAEDYELICKQENRNVIQVKALPSTDKRAFTLAVLPREIGKGDGFFAKMKNQLKKMLLQKAPVTIASRIDIIQVKYIAYCIKAEVAIDDYEAYQKVYALIEKRLSEYLNPITGNFDKKGFAIGELPTTVKIRNLIKTIEHIRQIIVLHINYYDVVNESWEEIDWQQAQDCGYAVPINGVHEIYIDIMQ